MKVCVKMSMVLAAGAYIWKSNTESLAWLESNMIEGISLGKRKCFPTLESIIMAYVEEEAFGGETMGMKHCMFGKDGIICIRLIASLQNKRRGPEVKIVVQLHSQCAN